MNASNALILVIDDNGLDRLFCRKALEKEEGLQVKEAPTLEAAVATIQKEPPDLIILDLMLGVRSGFDFLQARSRIPALARVPILVSSSLGDTASVRKAATLGAADYAVKPMDPEVLLLKAKRLLATSGRAVYKPKSRESEITLDIEAHVTRAGEDGFLLRSPMKLSDEAPFTVDCPVLAELGLLDVPAQIAEVVSSPGDALHTHEIRVAGQSEHAAQKARRIVRLWK